jgi:DNA-directed RNA polymerase subunit RPC12/RpoP
MSLPQEFWKELLARTDEQLYDALAHPEDYAPEALAAVGEELRKRNLSPGRISQSAPPPTAPTVPVHPVMSAVKNFNVECKECGQRIEGEMEGFERLIQCPRCSAYMMARPTSNEDAAGQPEISPATSPVREPEISMEWFYAADDNRFGPVSETTLIGKIKSGDLGRNCKIWKEGLAKWVLLENTPFREFLPKAGPPPLPTESADTASFTAKELAHNVWGKPKITLTDKTKMVLSLVGCLIILFPPIVPAYMPSGNPGLDAGVHILADYFKESDRLAGRSEFIPYWEKTQFTFIFDITKNDRIQIPILAGELALVGLLWVGLPTLKARTMDQKGHL